MSFTEKQHCGINKSSICFIRKNEGETAGGIETSDPTSAKISGVSFHQPVSKNVGLCTCGRMMKERKGHESVVLW